MREKARILIVDDDELICKSLTVIFRKQGYESETAVTGREAIEKAKDKFCNLAFLHIRLTDRQGIELLRPLKKINPDMMLIMVTAYASLESAVRALNEGASAYITKPLKKDELLATARECLEKQRLAAEKRRAEEELRQSEERYRMLVETMNDGLGLLEENGLFVYVNDKHCEMLGYSRKELIDRPITDFLPETGKEQGRKCLMDKRGKPILILYAEDDEEDRMLLQDALKESRLSNVLHIVEDGEELMEYLHRQGKYSYLSNAPLPSLILLDLNMSRKDGREALNEIKSNPNLRRIPVVVMTTSKAEEDILRTYDLGVSGFIIQPVTFESLVNIAKTLGKYWFEIVELPNELRISSSASTKVSAVVK